MINFSVNSASVSRDTGQLLTQMIPKILGYENYFRNFERVIF